jgi:hypothetical protein
MCSRRNIWPAATTFPGMCLISAWLIPQTRRRTFRNTNPWGVINSTPHGFYTAKNFLRVVIRFCCGSDISRQGSSDAEIRPALCARKERVAALLSFAEEDVCAYFGTSPTRRTVSDAPHRLWSNRASIYMSRVRHCIECPTCRTRYLPSSSPYRNGSYLIPLTAYGASGWILYCSCRMPPASSHWSSTDLKPYEICRQAYRRGYGSPDEVFALRRTTRI